MMGYFARNLLLLSGLLTALNAMEEKVLEIKSNAVTETESHPEGFSGQAHRSRRKRSIVVDLTSSEIQGIVDQHNNYRRQQGSSDMEEMTWNNYLAEMAQEWASACVYEHGQPARDPAEMPYSSLGQNLWASSATTRPSMSAATTSWYNEINDYTYAANSCGAVCGHYTQIVWSSTREIGCGYADCPNLTYRQYVVCNYGPPGNYVGAWPYQEGYPCTDCASGNQWCHNDLCKADCASAGATCECNALCQNCAQLNVAACTCECENGWYGTDCTVVCEDKHSNCNNGWYTSWCNNPTYYYVDANCLSMCSHCVEDANRVTCPEVTPTTCSEWSAWNEAGCRRCGGCGLRTRTRDCGANGIETESEDCDAKYCIRGEDPSLEWIYKQSPWTSKWRWIRRNRKCCYDFRWTNPIHLSREKLCAGRRVRGWKNA